MVAMAARSLSPEKYASFATWWATATLLATVFGVFEAHLTRLVITEIVENRRPKSVIGIMTGRAWFVATSMSVLTLIGAPWLATTLFHGSLSAALLLPVFVMIAATQSIMRGAATGHRRFIAVGGQLGTDGLLRALLVGVVVVAGRSSVTLFALAACFSAASSLLVGNHLFPQWRARPRLRSSYVPWRPVLFLLAGAVSPVLIYNGSVPWLSATHSVSAVTLGAFAGVMTLSRLPTQLGSAAFGPVLSYLSHAVDTGDRHSFRRTRRSAEAICLVGGIIFVLAFTLLGRWILSIYLGPSYKIPMDKMGLLAAASAVMLLAILQQAGLAAHRKWSSVGVSWMVSTFAFIVVLFLPVSTLERAALAPLAAVTVAYVAMALLIRKSERVWAIEASGR
jgi:O-antigen/teichoic acid export membrane protein